MRKFIAPKYWTTWLGIGFLWLLTKLPRSMRHAVGKLLAVLAWRFNRKRRLIVETNLALCFPEKNEIETAALGKQHFQAVGRSFMDMGLIWFGSDKKLLKAIRLEGWEHYESARAAGKNIILHVAHSAGLEFGAMAVGSRDPGLGPYNAVNNKLVDYYFLKGRRRFGNEAFERDDGMLAYTRALKKGKLLYTLTDEDHGPENSVYASLFNHPKATLPIVGRLAKISNATVLPTTTWYDAKQHQYVTTILPAIKNFPTKAPEEDAKKLNQALEQMILLAPEEYMWTLRIFRTQSDGRRVYDY